MIVFYTARRLCVLCLLGTAVVTAQPVVPRMDAAGPDEQRTPSKVELIEFAFDTASAIRIVPDLVERSRAQEKVVTLCLDLDLPDLAEKYTAQIKNWRRGTAHAFVALYWARQDEAEKAREHLDTAEEIAEAIRDWQSDRIRGHIATVYAYLKERDEVKRTTKGVDELEAARVNKFSAMVCTDDEYAKQVADLKKYVTSERFDIKRRGLMAAAQLFRTFYEDEKRRQEMETIVEQNCDDLSPYLTIELLFWMTDFALEHGDEKKAFELLEKAEAMFTGAHWRPENEVPLGARFAAMYSRAGIKRKGEKMAELAEKLYRDKGQTIPCIFRAEALAPLGAAYHTIDSPDAAERVYAKALEESIVSENLRPRAEDLCLIARSMARCGFEPSDSLWSRMREIRGWFDDAK